MNIPCVILCGGKSSRMGSDKALLQFKKTTLVQYQFKKMQKIFKNVYLSSKQSYFNLPYINDNTELFTPLIGIRNAFLFLNSQKIFFICVDTPLIPLSIIQSLLTESKNNNQAITFIQTPNKKHFLSAIWDKSTLPIIQKAINYKTYKIQQIFNQCKTNFLFFNNEKYFTNLNTPKDYENFIKENHG